MKIDIESYALSCGDREIADLADESSAVFRVHGDELDRDSVMLLMAAHNAAPAHLSLRHVQQDLHQTGDCYFFVGSQKNPGDRKVFHIRDFPLHACSPWHPNISRRLDPLVGPLFNV